MEKLVYFAISANVTFFAAIIEVPLLSVNLLKISITRIKAKSNDEITGYGTGYFMLQAKNLASEILL